MKSYTDIEQSKNLAEFLPLESADMYYTHGAVAPDIMIGCKQDYRCYTMCWSLAALLEIIPVITEYNDTSIRLRIDKGPFGNDEYAIWYEDLQTILSTDIEAEADNFIDACYKMIMRLHELNIL